MEELAKKLNVVSKVEKKKNTKKIEERINDTHTEELVIALCGPIGTDIHLVADRIEKTLSNKYNYECVTIKLSALIKKISNITDIKSASSYNDYIRLIDEGNVLRQKHGNSILAELAINEITVNREKKRKEENKEVYESNRICYIIDSIKHKDELDLFRMVYTDFFYFFGVFSPIQMRVENLKNEKRLDINDIHKLIDRDSGEDLPYGQKVTDTFVESDFFMRIDNNSSFKVDNKIERFLNLIFNSSIETPTQHETAMYNAYSSAGNSACLSRQVGASITDSDGEVLAVGWNDVPKAGGGVYKFNDFKTDDNRCMNIKNGFCHNDNEKRIINETLVNELIESDLVDESKKNELISLLKKSRIKELIEFSRAVHAEMLALINAGKKAGHKIDKGRLYCTTYPCHNCARHIVASGIKDVYYIEPYSKSLATKLHWDSITENETENDKLRILMYDGVAPNKYLFFFKSNSKRKKEGIKITSNFNKIKPKKTLSLEAIPILEKKVTEILSEKNLL